MSEIPDDIMEIARAAYAASPVKVQGNREANALIGVIARAILAEQERATAAERERCAKVAEAMPWHQHTSPDHIRATSPQDVAVAIRQGDQPSPSAGERGSVR